MPATAEALLLVATPFFFRKQQDSLFRQYLRRIGFLRPVSIKINIFRRQERQRLENNRNPGAEEASTLGGSKWLEASNKRHPLGPLRLGGKYVRHPKDFWRHAESASSRVTLGANQCATPRRTADALSSCSTTVCSVGKPDFLICSYCSHVQRDRITIISSSLCYSIAVDV